MRYIVRRAEASEFPSELWPAICVDVCRPAKAIEPAFQVFYDRLSVQLAQLSCPAKNVQKPNFSQNGPDRRIPDQVFWI